MTKGSTTTVQTTTDLGTVLIGKVAYEAKATRHEWIDHLRNDEHCVGTDVFLVGPKGAWHRLVPTNVAGKFALFSITGGQMRRGGNPVYVWMFGDMIEQAK